jgi:hypothetical protein
MKKSKTERFTKRQFLRRVIVGGGAVTFVAGDYLKPELETLLGSHVVQARGSGGAPYGNGKGWGPHGPRKR